MVHHCLAYYPFINTLGIFPLNQQAKFQAVLNLLVLNSGLGRQWIYGYRYRGSGAGTGAIAVLYIISGATG